MPPVFPPGGFSYIYIFLLCLVGRRGVVCGGPRSVARWRLLCGFGEVLECAVELWPGFCGGVAAREAWRVGGYGWCGSAELLRYTGERGIMGAAAHPNTKNPAGRRGSFYSF